MLKKNNGGWNTLDNYQAIHMRDCIKNEYCKSHNIQLIRIPYYDYDKINLHYLLQRIERDNIDALY